MVDPVTSMNMRARNACYREGYVNYSDSVDQPLYRNKSPGSIDPWFYSQVLSRNGASQDDLKDYTLVTKKKISEGKLVGTYSPFLEFSEGDLSSVPDDMPEQLCAKRCTLGACTGFTYDKQYFNGTCYIYNGTVKTADCPSCNTYMRKVPEPIPDRSPKPDPKPTPAPQPVIEVVLYQGENFTRGSTTLRFLESELNKKILGMSYAIVSWPNRLEVNSFVITCNAEATWSISFPSREKTFVSSKFSGKKGYGNLDGAGGYQGSIIVGKR